MKNRKVWFGSAIVLTLSAIGVAFAKPFSLSALLTRTRADLRNLSVSFNSSSTVVSGSIKSGDVVLQSSLEMSGLKLNATISGNSWGANNNDIARLGSASHYISFAPASNSAGVTSFKNIKSVSFTYNSSYNYKIYGEPYGYFKVYFATNSDFSDAKVINISGNDAASVESNTTNAKYVKITGYDSSHYAYITGVTIHYSCEEDTPAVVKTLDSISISGQTTSFTQGDTFVFGGTVTAHYTDSSTYPAENVTSSATFTGYDMSTAGDQTVTVSYTLDGITKTQTYSITVEESQGGIPSSLSGTFGMTASTYYTFVFSSDGTGYYQRATAFYSRQAHFTYTIDNNGSLSITLTRFTHVTDGYDTLQDYANPYKPFYVGTIGAINNTGTVTDASTFNIRLYYTVGGAYDEEKSVYHTFTKQ